MFELIKKHFKYGKYLLRHKYYVTVECFKVGLYWRGIKHDWDKFSISSWAAYANYFHKKNPRNSTGYYKPYDTGDINFDTAWRRHFQINDHHWQHWTVPTDDGKIICHDMSLKAVVEMVCDWIGAGKAQNSTGGPIVWFKANRDKMHVHKNTYQKIMIVLCALNENKLDKDIFTYLILNRRKEVHELENILYPKGN